MNKEWWTLHKWAFKAADNSLLCAIAAADASDIRAQPSLAMLLYLLALYCCSAADNRAAAASVCACRAYLGLLVKRGREKEVRRED